MSDVRGLPTSTGPQSKGAASDGELLVTNVARFARFLRAAGVPIGPGRVIEGIRAIQAVDVARRGDFYWALHAVFVSSGDQRPLFEQAFRHFWREAGGPGDAISQFVEASRFRDARTVPPASRRVAEAGSAPEVGPVVMEKAFELREASYSPREVLRRKDFEQMSAAEIDEATAAIERLDLGVKERATRRLHPDARGKIDMRRTLRASVRGGGAGISLRWRAPRLSPPPLVALCDISGSMGRYTRMFLRFLHALSNQGRTLQTFLFGTRLNHATAYLRHRDVDEALELLGKAVKDWSGGTRIGDCLSTFNRHWSRRVLGQGAVVLLITDGLDCDEGRALAKEMDRLHRSCRRLMWLNPLLRYEAFEPKALGIQAMLPHVDDFLPVHNLESLSQLVDAINGATRAQRPGRFSLTDLRPADVRPVSAKI